MLILEVDGSDRGTMGSRDRVYLAQGYYVG